jgi:HK97 family phage prohead protease/HK97 family phage major capsid protein
MMNKIFNLTSTFKSHTEDDGSIMIRGMASTADFDRAGDSISADAWTKGGLESFEKNPIILFNHDYNRPIGRATSLKSTSNGLELTAKISKAAKDVAELVKDGVLGAFSVGFRVKDADYIEETDGLRIKDAELFEVSVVSVPCNQSATFSLAKSFDSIEEYEDFKKTFTISDGTQVQKEIKMSEETQQPVDLEAFAKKVAEETAAKIAMKQAEQKAAQDAVEKELEDQATANAEAKVQQEKEVKQAVATAVESGAERLIDDIRKEMESDKETTSATIEKYRKDLEEKQAELTAIQNSKQTFSDRSSKGDVAKWGKEFMTAHLLGVMTRKGMNTDYGIELQEKAGIDYTTYAGDIDQEVSNLIEKEIQTELKVAKLFREIPVNGAATVLPIQPDVDPAAWAISATAGNLQNEGATGGNVNKFQPKQVVLNAYRLISSSFMDNDVDEQVLINLMPMIVESVARAHAKAVEHVVLNGNGTILGLDDVAAAHNDTLDISDTAKLTSALLLDMRQTMGKFGLNPSDLAYIVSQNSYFDLLDDPSFQTVDEVGSDLAVRVTGTVGAVYGTPVVVSDQFAAEAAGVPAAFVVNPRNYVIPRLRGVTVEQDYEVMNQRNVIVASQALGFSEIVPGGGGNEPCVAINFIA